MTRIIVLTALVISSAAAANAERHERARATYPACSRALIDRCIQLGDRPEPEASYQGTGGPYEPIEEPAYDAVQMHANAGPPPQA